MELQQLAVEDSEVRNSLLKSVSLRMKQNLMKIPLFAQMELMLERKVRKCGNGGKELMSWLYGMHASDSDTLLDVEIFQASRSV